MSFPIFVATSTDPILPAATSITNPNKIDGSARGSDGGTVVATYNDTTPSIAKNAEIYHNLRLVIGFSSGILLTPLPVLLSGRALSSYLQVVGAFQ